MKPSILIDSIGLNSKSADDSQFVAYHCQGIKDIEAFYEFCMQKKDMIEYQTKKERLTTLARKFKRIEEAQMLLVVKSKANNFTNELVRKVGECRLIVKNEREIDNNFGFRNISFFSIDELKALVALNVGTETIIELFEQDKLKDNLYNLYIEKFKEKSFYNALTEGEKKVKALLGGVK